MTRELSTGRVGTMIALAVAVVALMVAIELLWQIR